MGILPGDSSTAKYPFLAGGEMGKRISERDWDKTTAGPPDNWPPNLCITLNALLRNKIPSFLYWSSDLTIFYNDAARNIGHVC